MKTLSLLALSVVLAGCYGYTTTHTLKPAGKECSYNVRYTGNGLVGYDESDFTNKERAEKECRDWLK